ncbi:MAG: putative polymerase sigma factor [Nocardioidaceae bacterium]|nr:putative polymerase sigma factor [Nocardioidaceae bacterium]
MTGQPHDRDEPDISDVRPTYQEGPPDAPDDMETTLARPSDVGTRSVADLLADDDPRAWDELVARYAGLVWSVARGFRLDEAATADVTQQVWLTLVEHRAAIRDPERLGGWLSTTTRRTAIAALRRRDAQRPLESIEDEVDARRRDLDDEVSASVEEAEVRAEVRAAFARLSEACRTLLRLTMAEPKIEYAEIGRLVGRPVGSLGPTRRRCLDRLRLLLEGAEAVQP